VNLAVGVAVATAYRGFAAWQAGDALLVALGGLAGVFASVEAADVHDQQRSELAADPTAAEPADQTTGESAGAAPDLGAPDPLRPVA
jgi:hypothetical protein